MFLLSISNIDQSFTLSLNGSKSMFWDNLMCVVTSTWSWSALILLLIYIIFKNNSSRDAFLILLSMILMIIIADRLCSGLIKPMVARFRPTQDPDIMYLVDTVRNYRGGRYGFFSGHACNTACFAMFLSWLFRSKKMTFVLFFWSFTTTFTRIYLGVHYVGDVLVGWIMGCLIGYVFYKLYCRYTKLELRAHRMSDNFTLSGYLKSDMDIFMATVFLNYIVLIIISIIIGIK